MSETCSLYPSKGKGLFTKLKKQFGYDKAVKIFLTGIHPKFIQDHAKQLVLDEEGVPTYESLMKVSYVKSYIGEQTLRESIEKKFSPVEDTMDNYNMLLEEAKTFNDSSPNNDSYVAYVGYDKDNKLQVKIAKKTAESTKKSMEQYQAKKLNDLLSEEFKEMGVTVGSLSEAEVSAGRTGSIDFSKAKKIAQDFVTMIRVANNMEGARALSEEFAHLIVRVSKKDSLVARALKSLIGNEEALKRLLGDEYENVKDYFDNNSSLMAEEALGKILQEHLIKDMDMPEVPSESLFRRMVNFIRNKFKKHNADKVQQAIDEVNYAMDSLAKQFLKKEKQITRQQITSTEDNVKFNDLSDRIERNIKILKEADATEIKRFKIGGNVTLQNASDMHKTLKGFTKEDADTVLGICSYAKYVLSNLAGYNGQFSVLDTMEIKEKFGFLREVNNGLASFRPFVQALLDAYQDEEHESDNMFTGLIKVGEEEVDMKEMIKELSFLLNSLDSKFKKTAMPLFTEFLKPYLGTDKIVVPFGKDAGKEMTLESLLKTAESDISFFDRWLDSMAEAGDVVLQLFSKVVDDQKAKTRMQTIEDVKEVQYLMKKAESKGIKDFDYFFERTDDGKKTGNIVSEINQAQFTKDKIEFEKGLKEKYGKNPKGDKAKEMFEERRKWRAEHAELVDGKWVPNSDLYRNEDYFNLSEAQKEILHDWLILKAKFDSYLGNDRTYNTKAIQIRKTGARRTIESATSLSSLFDNLKQGFTESLMDKPDDESEFGVKSGLTDFSGKEFMQLPILYVNSLENPDELSTDVMGNLMAYIYMANNYKNMADVINPLEVGRTLMQSSREVQQTRGGLPVVERFRSFGESITNSVKVTESNINQRLNDYFESQVYGRYLKDQGSVGKVNVNKATSLLLKFSSLAQLGFNFLANSANVATGVSMQNIEAAAGEYFSGKELLKADKEYTKAMKDYIPEVGSRTKKSKLALFDELFDVKQDYQGKVRRSQVKSWLERLFGADVAFWGQGAGDHWLYNRTAIAMCIRQKVKVPGQGEMSLWEALQVRDKFKDSSDIKEIYLPEGTTDLEGNPISIKDISMKIKHVNHTLFGIYNDDDACAANRVAVGRLLLQYKKWIKPQMNKRFKKAQYVRNIDDWEEGYYRTFARIALGFVRGQYQIGALSEELKSLQPHEKANLKRAITELVQLLAVWACTNLIKWPDDKKRPWAVKYAEYMAQRLTHELGNLAPTPMFIQENLKTLKTPMASMSALQNLANLAGSLVDPRDWNDEMQSGPYKGHSTLYKNTLKAPIPVVAQYKMVDRFMNDLDTSISYYIRSY